MQKTEKVGIYHEEGYQLAKFINSSLDLFVQTWAEKDIQQVIMDFLTEAVNFHDYKRKWKDEFMAIHGEENL